jgi:hypothetical protein
VNNYTAVFTGGTGDKFARLSRSLTHGHHLSRVKFFLTVTVTDDSENMKLNVGSYDYPVNVRAV